MNTSTTSFATKNGIRAFFIISANYEKIINRNLMTKLAISNMCYIDEYTCAFREYYYKGTYNIEESKEIRKLYFTKLPEPFNSKVIKS